MGRRAGPRRRAGEHGAPEASRLGVLLRSGGNGEAGGMINWVISGVLLIIIVSTLVMLKRAERRRGR